MYPESTVTYTEVTEGWGGGGRPGLYSLFQTSSKASGHHGDSWTNKPAMRDDRVSPLSDH